MSRKMKHSSRDSAKTAKQDKHFQMFMAIIVVVGLVSAIRFAVISLDDSSQLNVYSTELLNTNTQEIEELGLEESAISTANFLHSSNPLFINLTGLIKEWETKPNFDLQDRLGQLKESYIQDTKIKPIWPVTWANLAIVKWHLQEFDEEMLGYLLKADKLGPQVAEIHVLFSRLGLSLYAVNHPLYKDIEDVVHTRMRLGIRNPNTNKPILIFINNTNSLSTACSWMLLKDKSTAIKHLGCFE